ncbi:hypothetical protein FEDK69T_19540 [Flavobacterium enshiense DK69]|uniref:Lipoprotein n=1 Tax=Flavobacterium enshiense DK69 TaxID=1107311 RepID=V6SE77_9FLAO|nr:hypothetical protein [Flavobacterium enshiense]ESU22695.1 hypothetical protein FEDK69T_19540 [Flavobacterium enshiense DK69]KGO95607.1 hypothetical protein Q767_10285 [Flavobacterium enshiense DK69]
MIRKTLGLLCLALSAVLFSCSSDDSNGNINNNSNNNPNNDPTTSFVAATIDGQSWSSNTDGVYAQIDNYDVGETHSHELAITGTNTNQSHITIILPVENLAEGTFSSTDEDFHGMLFYTNSNSNNYISTLSGSSLTLTISNLNLITGTISGTFSGTLVDMNGNSITIANGVFNIVTIYTSTIFSNGTMSLSKNGGDLFTMDSSPEDGKYLFISQHSEVNHISIHGNYTNMSSEMETCTILFPKNVVPGTYDLMTELNFGAEISSHENEAQYHLTNGNITISSHNGNNVVGTFSFTFSNGTNTVTISNGSFNITHINL